MAGRAVIVDDIDLSIHYVGKSWRVDQGSRDQVGNYGAPFRSTLHGTDSSASLSFQFSGTSFKVYGSNNIRNDSGVLDPKWECFIDHQSIGASEPFPSAENNWRFCERSRLRDGPHTLTINITVAKRQTFWLDRIEYVPSTATSVENSDILIESHDSGLRYGQGWKAAGSANMTQTKGSLFELEFTGISISWFSWILYEYSGNATTGAYIIDGGSSQTFTINGHPAGATTTLYNQKLFETPTLPMGNHNLSVIYNGNANSSPLILDYLIVQNGTVSPPSDDTGHDPPVPTKKSNVGPIVGGAVAGVCCVIIFLVAFIFFRRRRRRQPNGEDTSVPEMEPFQYQPVGQSSHHDPISSQPLNPTQGARLPANNGLHKLAAGDRSQIRSDNIATSSRNLSNPPSGGLTNQPLFEKIRQHELPQSEPHRRRSDSDGASPRVLRHEDSGVRNLSSSVEDVIELPPQYTP